MTKLAQVNLKINADNKILKDQMKGYDHRLYQIEAKNSNLKTENFDLNHVLRNTQVQKGVMSDLPL